jgi:GT2 family glycosyltransferase
MSVTVIIPHHGASLHLSLCLSSLQKERSSISEIIVVSNGNDSQDISEIKDPLIRIIHCKNTLGYSAAINRGAREAKYSFLLFCDADTFFPQGGWIKKHLELHRANPLVGITSSTLLNFRTDRILDFGIGYTRYTHFHPCKDALITDRRVQESRPVQMVCSAVMMIRRELFFDLGGFDESLHYYFQDLDLCMRLKEKQRQAWVVAGALAYHRGNSSGITRKSFQIDEQTYYAAKNTPLLEVDYYRYLDEALFPYHRHLHCAELFGFVNLSTMLDVDGLLKAVGMHASIEGLASWTPVDRDIDSITLSDVVGLDVLRYPRPQLILVDRCWSLRCNALWRAARTTSGDLVVDRHANAYLFDELTSNNQNLSAQC